MKKKQTSLYEEGEQIVLDLENEAENANYHDMCRMYRKLYEILLETVSEEESVKIMRQVKRDGGFLP